MTQDERRPKDSSAPDPELAHATEERAKDVLEGQPQRRIVGERLSRRVGRRRFERAPIVSCTGWIFARCELADPWDPDSKDRPLAHGPVAMKFEERRQPAPHAKVKQPMKKSDKPAWTPPKGIPDARSSPSVPEPSPRPAAQAPRKAPTPQPPAKASTEDDALLPRPPVSPPPRGVDAPKKRSSGRFRMRPTSTSGPRVRQVQRVVEDSAPDTPSAEQEVVRTATPQAQSLDDLFGNLGGGGRDKRVGKKKD